MYCDTHKRSRRPSAHTHTHVTIRNNTGHTHTHTHHSGTYMNWHVYNCVMYIYNFLQAAPTYEPSNYEISKMQTFISSEYELINWAKN